jgi:hypothetical protein
METVFTHLNNSKIFTGCIMMIVNIGGRHMTLDVPENANKLFEHWIVRSILIFSLSFIATRDVSTSFKMCLIFFIIFKLLLNENSKMCIIPKNTIKIDTNNDGKITMDEIIRAQKTVDSYRKKLENGNDLV